MKDREGDRNVANVLALYQVNDLLILMERAARPRTRGKRLTTLNSGRNAITASKCVVAESLAEWITLQRTRGQDVLHSASCTASLPVVHALEIHFRGEEVLRIGRIVSDQVQRTWWQVLDRNTDAIRFNDRFGAKYSS